MLTVVGLGNPGRAYRNTRHNAGFMLLDGLVTGTWIPDARYASSAVSSFKSLSEGKSERSGLAVTVEGELEDVRFLLVKPSTFMNESGRAIASLVTRGYIRDLSDLLVVVDDVDLPVGAIRLRSEGGAGGHNGLKSLIAHLGSGAFPRVRIGMGPRPSGAEMVDYVLGTLRPEEYEPVERSLGNAAQVVEGWLRGHYENAVTIAARISATSTNR